MSLAAYIQKIIHFCARHRKLLLSICGTLCAVALFFYLRAFFATGVDMDGAFLTKQIKRIRIPWLFSRTVSFGRLSP